MRNTLRYLLLIGVAVISTTTMKGQQTAAAPSHHEVDLALTYSAQRSNLTSGSNFWRQGGTVELSAEAYRGLGIAMNINGSRSSNINGTGVNLTTVTTTFGPRYTWSRPSRKLSVFGQGLIGGSHGMDSVFPSPAGVQTDFNAFALQVGGGVDLHLSRHIALRPLQADWIRTEFPNASTNVQNNLRLGAGVVFRLQR
jgi:outer membrane immunogenic protein